MVLIKFEVIISDLSHKQCLDLLQSTVDEVASSMQPMKWKL